MCSACTRAEIGATKYRLVAPWGRAESFTVWVLQKTKMAAALRRVGQCTGYALGQEAALLRDTHHDPAELGVHNAPATECTLDEGVLRAFLHQLQLAR